MLTHRKGRDHRMLRDLTEHPTEVSDFAFSRIQFDIGKAGVVSSEEVTVTDNNRATVGWDRKDGGARQTVVLPAEPPDSLEQYDLLRVLTTELRRLLRDGRNPEVRLRQGRRLAADRLARILELV